MDVSEVRRRYLDFFAKRGHTIIPSAPIVPENDPSTLFTSSGMQPLVPYLLGQPHPEGNRLVDAQMSFRAEDIEEIGDNRHTTFFEMLGNWSLGDYFKQEQLPWLFEYLTNAEEGLGLDPHRLYVTVFGGDKESGMEADTESVEIWKSLFNKKGIEAAFVELDTEKKGGEAGMQGGRIFSYGAKKNWWSRAGVPSNMPPGEIGGPDSEVFYDFGLPHDEKFGKECHPNCDCGRFVEVGNSVFMQFVKRSDGAFEELPKRNVDFGGGLERLTAATRGNHDIFLIDVFDAARSTIESRALWKYGQNDETRFEYRIILDHIRAAAFMFAGGIRPSNTEQGYVLRRLVRRAILAADRLGIKDAVLADVAKGFGISYAEHYPFISEQHDVIREGLQKEEEQFRKTLASGLRELDRIIERSGVLSGDDAFFLFTTYGFPLELTLVEIGARNIKTSDDLVPVFKERFSTHLEKSRAGAAQKFAGGLADHAEQTIRYHTAHHLLLKALQTVLGPDVHQRGSNITSERLRIDFSYGEKMTPEQKEAAEKIVNDAIDEELPVTRVFMKKEDAERIGAEHEFGATYPAQVSVYSVGPKGATEDDPRFSEAFSIEFCGGPHVSNTRELGEGGKRFRIKKEEASSSGIRRIKAVLE